MKIRITFDLTDDMRRAIAYRYGKPGKAPYLRCKRCIEDLAVADLDVVESEYLENETHKIQES